MDFDHNSRLGDLPIWLISIVVLAVALMALAIVWSLPAVLR